MMAYSRSLLYICLLFFFSLTLPPPPTSTLFPYTTLFRSRLDKTEQVVDLVVLLRDLTRESRIALEKGRHAPDELRLDRSEEHTSELQSRGHLVCRLLLEKKKKKKKKHTNFIKISSHYQLR